MRVLTAVVQRATLAVLDSGQDLALGRAVALQLIGDDDAWHVLQPLEQLAEKRRCLTGVDVLFSMSVSEAEYPQRERVAS